MDNQADLEQYVGRLVRKRNKLITEKERIGRISMAHNINGFTDSKVRANIEKLHAICKEIVTIDIELHRIERTVDHTRIRTAVR